MDKERLEQYIDLCREAKKLKQRIAKLRKQKKEQVSDTVTTSTNWPYSPHQTMITGTDPYITKKIAVREDRLQKLQQKVEQEKEEIEKWIAEIPDSKTRQVFMSRYIDGNTWQKVAGDIGETDEQYPRKCIHNKYLESNKCTKSTKNI